MDYEQIAAEKWAKEKVERIEIINSSIGRISIWKTKQSLPTIKFGTFIDSSGSVKIPNDDVSVFQTILSSLAQSTDNITLICDIYKKLNKSLVSILQKLPPYLSNIETQWFPPTLESKTARFIVEDLTEGIVKEVVISDTEVCEKKVCEGNSFGLK